MSITSSVGAMQSIQDDINSVVYPYDNVLSFNHISCDTPVTLEEDSNNTDDFYIEKYLICVYLLNFDTRKSSTCIKGLSLIIKLFRTKSKLIREYWGRNDSAFDSLFRTVTELVEYRNSVVDEAAQNDEYMRFLEEKLMPQKLLGFESIWKYVFDYHRSVGRENRGICRLGYEVLMATLDCLRDDLEIAEEFMYIKLSRSTFVSALLTIMSSMLKYADDHIIISLGTTGIMKIVTFLRDDNLEDMTVVVDSLRLVTTVVKSHIGSRHFIIDFCSAFDIHGNRESSLYSNVLHPTLSLCDEFVDILQYYHQDSTVTRSILQIIKYSLQMNSNNIQSRLTSASLPETIVLTINSHPLDDKIALDGCLVIDFLAQHSPSNRTRLGAAGACEAVVKSFSKHGTAFSKRGLFRPIVRSLAYGNTENKYKLLYLGAGDWVPHLNVSGWLDGDESEQGGDY